MTPQQKLTAWRERHGLGQNEAAKIAGIPQSRWSYIERGLVCPSLVHALKIWRATGCIEPREWPDLREVRQASTRYADAVTI